MGEKKPQQTLPVQTDLEKYIEKTYCCLIRFD